MRCTIHDSHKYLTKDIDYLGYKFKMRIYDYKPYLYTEHKDWCPADDIVSEQIDKVGYWERYETALVSDILKQPRRYDMVYDFGSQVGWYSLLALLNGYEVVSYEADEDSAELLRYNARLNGFKNIKVNNIKVDKKTKKLRADKIHLVKCDIEGAEEHAFRVLEESFTNKDIDYAMFEISPTFNGSYQKLVKDITSRGYSAYIIPNGKDSNEHMFLKNPLFEIQKQPLVDTEDIRNWHQRNVVFIRNA